MAVESPGRPEEQQPSGSATVDEHEPRDPDGGRDPRLAFTSPTDNAPVPAPVPTQGGEDRTAPGAAADDDADGPEDGRTKPGPKPAGKNGKAPAGGEGSGPKPKGAAAKPADADAGEGGKTSGKDAGSGSRSGSASESKPKPKPAASAKRTTGGGEAASGSRPKADQTSAEADDGAGAGKASDGGKPPGRSQSREGSGEKAAPAPKAKAAPKAKSDTAPESAKAPERTPETDSPAKPAPAAKRAATAPAPKPGGDSAAKDAAAPEPKAAGAAAEAGPSAGAKGSGTGAKPRPKSGTPPEPQGDAAEKGAATPKAPAAGAAPRPKAEGDAPEADASDARPAPRPKAADAPAARRGEAPAGATPSEKPRPVPGAAGTGDLPGAPSTDDLPGASRPKAAGGAARGGTTPGKPRSASDGTGTGAPPSASRPKAGGSAGSGPRPASGPEAADAAADGATASGRPRSAPGASGAQGDTATATFRVADVASGGGGSGASGSARSQADGGAVPGARVGEGSEGALGASRGGREGSAASGGSEAAEARVEGDSAPGRAREAAGAGSGAADDAPDSGSDSASGAAEDTAHSGPGSGTGVSDAAPDSGSGSGSGLGSGSGSGSPADAPDRSAGFPAASSRGKDSATASFRLVAEAEAAKAGGDDRLRAAVAAWVTKTGDDGPGDAAAVAGDVDDVSVADEPADAVPDTAGSDDEPADTPPAGKLAGPPGSTFVPLKTDADLPPKPAAPPPPPTTPPAVAAPPAAPAAPPAVPAPAAAPDSAPPKPPAGPDSPPGWERTQQQPLPPYEEKRPLDLLAELTNTPPPPETLTRTLVRRVKIWTPLVILLAIILGVVQMLRPLPAPTLTLTAASGYSFEGGTPEMPWPSEGQASIDVAGLGSLGSYGKQKSVPIGSVAKVMTAYVILRDHPMKPGGKGASIPVDDTAVDEAALSSEGETTVELDPDSKLSQKEALQALLIASANNVARLLARWHSDGDMQAFVDEMNKTAEELGMDGTTYSDPSGLKESTVSTAEDQVILGKAAMKDPLFKQIVAMPVYTDSRGDDHDNSNKMVPLHGIGIKVGSTTKAGGNFLFATEKKVAGEQQLIVGAVLGQYAVPQLPTAMEFGRQLMAEGEKALTDMTVVKKGDVVGEVEDGLGGTTPVVATEDVVAPGWGGLKVGLELGTDRTGEVPHEGAKGDPVGVLTMGSGQGEVRVPVALAEDMAEPGIGAKLSRLG
ncbi:D-alanyl-D-alanine carboxypeptidase [Streptomyces sp. NPDC004134]|uniref:D-alanyl-D-alanine carboxypeptidase n=1 Tax=Streptomyces sp. NPDC004134 TaxID=3364691 RepID=UPI0036A9B8EE